MIRFCSVHARLFGLYISCCQRTFSNCGIKFLLQSNTMYSLHHERTNTLPCRINGLVNIVHQIVTEQHKKIAVRFYSSPDDSWQLQRFVCCSILAVRDGRCRPDPEQDTPCEQRHGAEEKTNTKNHISVFPSRGGTVCQGEQK